MRIADLAGQRVAVWGFGREGRTAIRTLQQRLPKLPLTLFCNSHEVAAARDFSAKLQIIDAAPDASLLSNYDVVVKSPGISAYLPAIQAARAHGTEFTSGTALWFGEHPQARVIAITGTKGKSTTAALIAHLARALGLRTALAGNIGLPLLELIDRSADLWVIELSSFQTSETGSIELGVITSLYEEHLDWHGSRECYVADKLKLADKAHRLLVNGTQAALLAHTDDHPRRLQYGVETSWFVRDHALCHAGKPLFARADLPVPGMHNALNACGALAALDIMGFDAVAALPALKSFHGLPHRLQPLGERHGFRWINDSISTTPEASLAALDAFPNRAVTLIIGGFERGLNWSHFVQTIAHRPDLRLVAQGANAPRISRVLHDNGIACKLEPTLESAIARCHEITPLGGTILLSPGAPSFDQFHDYAERGNRFAELAGFDAMNVAIQGLGIA